MPRNDIWNQGFVLVSAGNVRGEQPTFSDTDPQMLHALWMMETGHDPERSLDEVQQARVVYDKFRPRISNRKP